MYDISNNNWEWSHISMVAIMQSIPKHIFLDIFDFVHNIERVIYNLYYIFL